MAENIDLSEERIRCVDDTLNSELNNIAKNIGIAKCDLLRKKMRLIIDAFPDELKQPKTNHKSSEVRIKGLSPKTMLEIKNISDNIGITRTSFLKLQLYEIAKEFPKEMRVDNRD